MSAGIINASLGDDSLRCNSSDARLLDDGDWIYTIGVTIFALVFVVSVVAVLVVNCVLLVAVLGDRELRRGALAALVVSLSAADILMTLIVLPIIGYELGLFPLMTADTYIRLHYPCRVCFGTTILALIAVSIEQYCAVVRPFSLQSRRLSPFKQGLVRAAVVWVVAALLAVPSKELRSMEYRDLSTEAQQGTEVGVNGTSNRDDGCAKSTSGQLSRLEQIHAIYTLVAYCIVPLILIGAFYGLTTRTLLRQVPCLTGSGSQQKRRRGTAGMLVALTTIDIICLVPGHVIDTMAAFGAFKTAKAESSLGLITGVMLYLNSLLAPVMLCIMCDKYRIRAAAVYRQCCCPCCRRAGSSGQLELPTDANTASAAAASMVDTSVATTETLSLGSKLELYTVPQTAAGEHELTLTEKI